MRGGTVVLWGALGGALVGCGGGGATGGDGAPPGVDAGGDGGAAGSATVRVTTSIGTAVNGIWVLSHDPSGNPVDWAERPYGAPGDPVTVEVEPDGWITVASVDARWLYTVTGVQPGDTLSFQPAHPEPAGEGGGMTDIAAVNVYMPGALASASDYVVDIGCGVGMPVGDGYWPFPGADFVCLGGGSSLAILGWARDASGAPTAFSHLVAPVTIGGDPHSETMTLPAWRTDFGGYDVDVVGPSGVAVSVLAAPTAGNLAYAMEAPREIASPGVETFVAPTGFGDGAFFRVARSDPPGSTRTWERAIASASVAGVTADLDALLPAIESIDVDVADPTRAVVAWSVGGDAGGADVAYLFVHYRDAIDLPYFWWIAMDSSATSWKIPELPDVIGGHRATAIESAELELIESDAVDGFQGFRLEPNAWRLAPYVGYGPTVDREVRVSARAWP